jgi:DNA repair exonuclease SbcCD ATPase subunit
MISTVAETLFHKVTKNRYASYQLSNDYEVIINTHQGFVRKLSTISGSENDLANLCLRLAIATLRSNKLVGNLGFIILDEISSSFDEERTKQTLEGLLELKDIIPQIINITHKPVEMKFADKLITVKEVNNRAFIS